MVQVFLSDGRSFNLKASKPVQQTLSESLNKNMVVGGWNAFVRRFNPVRVSDIYPKWGGCSFIWESCLLKELNLAHIWTVVDYGGIIRIFYGVHTKSRLGYIITHNPRESGTYKQYNYSWRQN